jgi:hypothetical protein
MTNRKGFRYVPGVVLAASVAAMAVTSGGCSSTNSPLGNAGCSEFSGGSSSIASLSIDAKTKAFVQAGADFVAVSTSMETAVFNACKGIDTDLGVMDTWSAMSGLDNQTMEACSQAQAKISAVLNAQASAQASCTLAVSGGGCTVDVNAQANCEATCSGMASCTPPDVTVVCDPGQLSGQCSGNCSAMATCEGTAMVAAQCQGSCEADCQGTCTPGTAPTVHCEGTCMGKCVGTCNGTATGSGGMANCSGTCSGTCDAACTYTAGKPAHCDGSCKGSCTGNCKLDANASINCGANVSCKGGCSVMYTAPKCEGDVKPPMCTSDVNCQGSCQAHAEATAMCTPPSAKLECSASAMGSADIQKLVATVQTNLPALIEAIQTQGQIAIKAGEAVAATGGAVVQSAGSLGVKAVACATAAVQASVQASASVNVSVMASANVSGSCGGPTS